MKSEGRKKGRKKIILKRTLGRYELIDLPELGIRDIKAKIDTGAYTSSIHCDQITIVRENGKTLLEAHFYSLDSKKKKKETILHFDTFTRKRIKNSFGKSEMRYLVTKKIIMYGEEFWVDFSLSNRKNLKFPILLGRKFLKGRFLVDVAKSNLNRKKGKRKII